MFGTVVQPWKAVTDDEPAPQVESRFAAFDTPGYVKVAFNIRVEPYGSGRALITTETRTAATDPASLRRFARYWLLAFLVQRADLPAAAADREIRCRATTWPDEQHPPTRRVSLAARRGPAGWCQRIGIGSPVPAQRACSVPAGDLTPETADRCPHRTPAPNAGLSGGGGHAERRTATARTTPKDRPRCP